MSLSFPFLQACTCDWRNSLRKEKERQGKRPDVATVRLQTSQPSVGAGATWPPSLGGNQMLAAFDSLHLLWYSSFSWCFSLQTKAPMGSVETLPEIMFLFS